MGSTTEIIRPIFKELEKKLVCKKALELCFSRFEKINFVNV